jgi:enolase
MKIKKIDSLEVLDSRGRPTVYSNIHLECGAKGSAMVPSGASTGSLEAHELRDGDNRYLGLGTKKAAASIKELNDHLVGQRAEDQRSIDEIMIDVDGTANKSNLGANAILAVSLATARAAANSLNIPLYEYMNIAFKSSYEENCGMSLPKPMLNIFNGGAHANNSIDIQEFMIMPSDNFSFNEGLAKSTEIYMHLKKNLAKKGFATTVGDEGGFAPNFDSNEQVIEEVVAAVESAGLEYGKDIFLALDCASTELYKNDTYEISGENKILTKPEMVEYINDLVSKYDIKSVEDPFDEQDWESWKSLTALNPNVQIVGDDIFVTQKDLLKKGIEEKAGNSILIKLNQVGTLSETFETIALAKANGFGTIISHRSGETEDTFIADLSVAVDARQIKTGAPARSDRTAKYNRLLIIEDELYP